MLKISGTNEAIKRLIDDKRDVILNCKSQDDPDVLVYDGIVDEETFAKQDKKILFLLKDGNDPNKYEDGNGYTYFDLITAATATSDENSTQISFYPMWRIMSMMMRIIEDSQFEIDQCWSEKQGFDTIGMRGYLKHFATVNIKKSAGKGTNDSSYGAALKSAVKNYYDLVKAEIALIKPDVVICGSTFDFIKNQYNAEVKMLPNNKRYFEWDGSVYLEYWHPSARFGYAKHFELFKETYTELLRAVNLVSNDDSD